MNNYLISELSDFKGEVYSLNRLVLEQFICDQMKKEVELLPVIGSFLKSTSGKTFELLDYDFEVGCWKDDEPTVSLKFVVIENGLKLSRNPMEFGREQIVWMLEENCIREL